MQGNGEPETAQPRVCYLSLYSSLFSVAKLLHTQREGGNLAVSLQAGDECCCNLFLLLLHDSRSFLAAVLVDVQ